MTFLVWYGMLWLVCQFIVDVGEWWTMEPIVPAPKPPKTWRDPERIMGLIAMIWLGIVGIACHFGP